MTKKFRPAWKETTRDCSVIVHEPTCPTEFEVQAYLWSELKKLGINARGEVKCAFKGRSQVRFDIAIFEHGALVGVIECKRENKQAGSDWSATRQGHRYSQFDVPVRLVRGISDADMAIEDARRGWLWGRPP